MRTHLTRRGLAGDDGIGVVTVVFVMAVVLALTMTAVTVAVNNLTSTSRDRQALAALATSEAGVSAALNYLRSGNLGSLTCLEPPPGQPAGPTCQGPNEWTNATSPKQVRLDGAVGPCTPSTDCTRVWISTVKRYDSACPESRATPPQRCAGTYRIHTTGFSGNGPSARRLAVDVQAKPYPFPIGVFTEAFSGNGNTGIHRMSVFSNGCIINRQRDDASGSGFRFEWDAANSRPALDVVHDQPASAHSTDAVSSSNNVCGDTSGGQRIHRPGSPACNPTYRFDQSTFGAALTPGDGCYGAYVRSDGTVYPTSSRFTQDELQKYGYRPRGLTDSEYDALRTQAMAQGTYNLPVTQVATRMAALAAGGISSPVLYWDNGPVSISAGDIPAAYKRTIDNDSPSCGSRSVTIVSSGPGNNLTYSGGNTSPFVVGSLFVPDATYISSAGTKTIGTIFARTIDLGGNPDFYMDKCFAANPPGAVLDVTVVDWREDDGKDIN